MSRQLEKKQYLALILVFAVQIALVLVCKLCFLSSIIKSKD